MLLKRGTLGLCVLGAAILGVAGSADAVSMSTLLGMAPNNVIVVGNTVYSNFTYGGVTPASDVEVSTATDASGNQTLSFTTTTSGWTTPNGSSQIGYDVTLTGASVSSAALGFTATATGGAAAFVGETITDSVNNKNYSLQVYTDGLGNSTPNPTTADINPAAAQFHVLKSIDVAAGTTPGTATITLVDNTYTQNPTGGGSGPSVPEPMSLALLPLGIVALGLRKRKLAH